MKSALAVLCILAAACTGFTVTSESAQGSSSDLSRSDRQHPAAPADAFPATVDYVQDGDSMRVIIDGVDERIRLIGVNTPEQGECFGDQARTILDDLVGGRQVLVATDIEATDQFGRILAYVFVDDIFVNAEIVSQGAALARAYEPNVSLQNYLDDAEALAQDQQLGMWSPVACGPASGAELTIVEIAADAPGRDNENLNGEWIIIANTGPSTVDISHWTVKDESSVHRFQFPAGTTIASDTEVVVFTGCGTNNLSEFYWCDETPVWDNSGDTGFVLDANGAIIDQFSY